MGRLISQKAMVFKLYACCIPVRGARRSTVCDLQRGSYHFIPNGLYEILTEHRNKTFQELEEAYGAESRAVLHEYFDFLEGKELGFWTDEPESFPDLDRGWQTPEAVTNAIVDVNADSDHDWASIFSQLDDLGCKALQIRFYCDYSLVDLDAILEHTMFGRLRGIDLYLKWTPELTMDALRDLVKKHGRVPSITIHSAPDNEVHYEEDGTVALLFVKQEILSDVHCGQARPSYFLVGTSMFLESMSFNSCLNRKLSVDVNGEIRNCPSMPTSYGNISDTRLESVVEQESFQEIWGVTKDQVEVCKDCEFRYICQDCRAWVQDPEDRLSKPAKCGYDPYTAQWTPNSGVKSSLPIVD